MHPTNPATIKQRILSIDILRGIIMVIMALDHVRDFFTGTTFDPLDLSQTSPQLFLTRWITHFCAPTFVFLAGTSAFLSAGSKTKKQVSGGLLKRGLWLLLLELTVINFGWMFDPGFHVLFLQVIWAIGWSMIVLSALVYLKPLYIGLFGLLLIFGHNALDGIHADTLGQGKMIWQLLHEQAFERLNSYEMMFALYPLIPWIGVMAAGYVFGSVFKLEPAVRQVWLMRIGLACLALFVVLRFWNIYGDPFPWQVQPVWWKSVLAFVKCHKYPPSLLYLLMTLGVSILALAGLERANNKPSRIFIVYGRVPMFYYILHIYLIHAAQIITALLISYPVMPLLTHNTDKLAVKWGFGLPGVYLIWFIVVVALYFPCRWFMRIKQTRKNWWLSYI